MISRALPCLFYVMYMTATAAVYRRTDPDLYKHQSRSNVTTLVAHQKRDIIVNCRYSITRKKVVTIMIMKQQYTLYSGYYIKKV